jgi:putative CocE/NonD family hydrolase
MGNIDARDRFTSGLDTALRNRLQEKGMRDRFLTPSDERLGAGSAPDIVVERDVAVPMRDGTVLRADVWRPAAAQGCPVLLQRTPYSKADLSVSVVQAGLDPVRAVEAGYAVVIQDCRGRFGSGGAFRPFVDEGADGEDTIAWCAALPFSSGLVGMYGQSYFGATQLLAAARRPPALRAIAPALTGADYAEGWTFRDGALELGFVLYWTLSGLAPDAIARQPEHRQAALRAALLRRLNDPMAAYERLPVDPLDDLVEAVGFYRDWLHRAPGDPAWRALAPNARYGDVAVPALHIGGWFDPFLAGTLENFAGLQDRGEQRLVVGPWAHACLGDTVGDVDFGPTAAQAAVDWTALHLGWFDRHLRGVDTGRQPPVRYFMMGAREWMDGESWPPTDTVERRWHLHSGGAANTRHGDGQLSEEPCGPDEHADRFVYDPRDPVPTTGGAAFLPGIFVAAHAGPRDHRAVEERADVLVYSSAPLERALDVAGDVRVALSFTSDAVATDICARLVDVAPDGRAIGLCDGIRADVAPDQERPITVRLGATATRFRAGHRIRLEVTSSNFPRFARSPSTGVPRLRAGPGELVPARQRVHHDARRPSFLALPIRAARAP